VNVGDLVRMKDGSSGIVMKIVTDQYGVHPWALLHSGEKVLLRNMEVIDERG